MQKKHDTYLIYHKAHLREAEYLARKLLDDEGLKPCLQEWDLIPGQPILDQLAEGIVKAKSVLVLIGGLEFEGWEKNQIRLAFQIKVDSHEFPLIPVILPLRKTSNIPAFLNSLVKVKYIKSIEEEKPFQDLLCAIRGMAPSSNLKNETSIATPNLSDWIEKIEDAIEADDFPKAFSILDQFDIDQKLQYNRLKKEFNAGFTSIDRIDFADRLKVFSRLILNR